MPLDHAAPAAAADEDLQFSLLVGGPLFGVLRRVGIVDEALHFLWRRIAVVVGVTWVPLAVLAALEGGLLRPGKGLSFLTDIGCHTRFLLVVPLLMIAEIVVHSRMRPLVDQFRTRGLVRPEDSDRFADAVRRAYRLRNSAVAEALLFAAIYASTILYTQHQYPILYPNSWYIRDGGLSPAGTWFVFISLPLFRLLILRWYFRVLVWAVFLFRVARLDLKLDALHPDKAGGLGFLGASLMAFVPLAAAHGVLVSGYLADLILYSGAKLLNFKLEIIFGGLWLLAVFGGPLLLFAPMLARVKRAGLREYGGVAQDYVRGFRAKWIDRSVPVDEPLVGTGDIQSLADLGNSYSVAEQMRVVPLSRSATLQFVTAYLIPIAPLLLTVMPADQLAESLVKMVF